MLSSLPPELVVQIFKSLPSFDAILALKDADETLARIWELNIRSILAAQVTKVKSEEDYVLNGKGLKAYQTLLAPQKIGLLRAWGLLGSGRDAIAA